MTKKEQIEKMIYYYDHRDSNNIYVTEDGRKYVFNSDYIDRDFMIKHIKKIITGSSQKKHYNGETYSAQFLSEMKKYKGRLNDLLSAENKQSFYEELRSSILKNRKFYSYPGFNLDFASFEWACLTVPRAWL